MKRERKVWSAAIIFALGTAAIFTAFTLRREPKLPQELEEKLEESEKTRERVALLREGSRGAFAELVGVMQNKGDTEEVKSALVTYLLFEIERGAAVEKLSDEVLECVRESGGLFNLTEAQGKVYRRRVEKLRQALVNYDGIDKDHELVVREALERIATLKPTPSKEITL